MEQQQQQQQQQQQNFLDDFSKLNQGIEAMKTVEDNRKDLQSRVDELQTVEKDMEILARQLDDIIGGQLLHNSQENIHINDNVFQDLEIFNNYQFQKENTVFEKINRSQTIYGKHFLKDMLSHPINNVEILNGRQDILKQLIDNRQLHQKLTNILKIQKSVESQVLWFWKEDDSIETIYEMVYFDFYEIKSVNNWINSNQTILQSLNFYKIFLNPAMTILIPILTFLIPLLIIKLTHNAFPIQTVLNIIKNSFSNLLGGNMFLPPKAKFVTYMSTFIWLFFYFQSVYYSCSTAYYTNKIINVLHQKINYVASLVKTVEDVIQTLSSPNEILEKLYFYKSLKENGNKIKNLFQDSIFQKDVGWFTNKGIILSVYHRFIKNLDELKPYLRFLGEVDCYNSLATLYQELSMENQHVCLVKYKSKIRRHPVLKIKDGWDVSLLGKKVVPNDLKLQKYGNLILTGPNAAGKSTYIKSIATNVLLAQTVGLAMAKSFLMTPFSVINTYLNIPDCIGKSSLFEAEMYRAKEHLELIDNLAPEKFSFVVMDEIFSSTNYVEGFSAAYAIIKKLIHYPNSVSIITTHYADLSRLENDTKKVIKLPQKGYKYYVRNFKMTCDMKEDKNGIPVFNFPYKIESGVSQQYIALDILKKNNFDESIIKEAIRISKKVVRPKCV